MKALKPILRILLPVVVIAIAIGLYQVLLAMRPDVQPASPEVLAPLVEVVEATAGEVELIVRAQGTVAPRTESRLKVEVSGRVIEVAQALVAGGFFEHDEVLLRIDPIDYDLAEKVASMRVAGAELRLQQELADAEVAARQWDSVRGGGAAPPLVLREPQIAEARAARAAAQAALEKARRDVGRCTITAPYAGRVRAENVDLGEFVQRGQELAVVYAVDFAEVRLPLPDADLAFLDLPLSYRGEAPGGGPVVEIVAHFAGGEHAWTGRIVRTEGELDPESRMVIAVARVPDPYGRSEELDRPPLAVGMFVEATIRGRRLASVVTLPREALRGADRVLVVDGEGRLEIRTVKPLKAEREVIVLASGVEPGERIVVSPIENFVDGMMVRVLAREPLEQQPRAGTSR